MDKSFSSLPTVVQLNILRRLSWADSKNSKLVCSFWLQMINYIKKPHYIIMENKKMEVVINSSYEIVGRLALGFLEDPFPINSSSRINLPKTLWLTLMEGNSRENVLKLLRYYIPTSVCESVCFMSCCLSNIEPHHLSKRIEYDHLRKFWFDLHLVADEYDDDVDELDDLNHSIQLTKHLKALAHFLRSVRFENLTDLNLTVTAQRQTDFDDQPLPDNYAPLLNLPLESFSRSLEVFLKTHAKQLQYLCIKTPALLWIDQLQHAAMDVNWLELKITHLDRTLGFNFTNDVVKSITAFKKLVVLVADLKGIHLGDCIKALSLLLKNNKDSLKDVKVMGLDDKNELYLDWLYSNKCLKLTQLDLDLNSCYEASIQKGISLNYKIQSLRRLIIDWWVEDEESEDWGLKWILQIGPNLENLELTRDPNFKLRLTSIFKLIKSLTKLEFIQLCSANYGDEDEDEILSPEVEPWFVENRKDEICGEWDLDKHYFKIWIRAPLDAVHYPQPQP